MDTWGIKENDLTSVVSVNGLDPVSGRLRLIRSNCDLLTDNTVVASLPVILSKASAKNIPVFGSEIEQVKIGCLAAMGLDYVELGKQTGEMAAKVLKGEAKASELNFETIKDAAFYGNTKVAENLGITLPESLTGNAAELFDSITE